MNPDNSRQQQVYRLELCRIFTLWNFPHDFA